MQFIKEERISPRIDLKHKPPTFKCNIIFNGVIFYIKETNLVIILNNT